VPDEQRAELVVDALSHLDAADWALFQVATLSEAVPALLGPAEDTSGTAQEAEL